VSKPFPPQIAICHSTARPDGWQESWSAWQAKRSDPGLFYEYVLCMDARHAEHLPRLPHEYHRTVVNYGRECCNVAHNVAASVTSAPLIVIGADDVFPCQDWDIKLLKAVQRAGKTLPGKFDELSTDDFVIWVSTGNPNDKNLILIPILSRARFLRYGYAVWDEYPSVCADNDFSMMADRDGVIIDARDFIRFEHRHFTVTGEAPDEVYARQNAPELYRAGEEILARRIAEGFPAKNVPISTTRKLTLAVCLPGETFRNEWVANWTQLFAYLLANTTVYPIPGYAPNPHITRASMMQSILAIEPLPDLVLWIDHDNLVSPSHFAQLLDSLMKHPEADGVTGWCWWGTEDNLKISCGRFDKNGVAQLYTEPELMRGKQDVKEIGFTGFPCFLMKGEALRKAGRRPFLPILSEEYPWGFAPEDIAFSKAARDRGCRFFVDRRVEVEHRKVQSLRPYRATQQARIA